MFQAIQMVFTFRGILVNVSDVNFNVVIVVVLEVEDLNQLFPQVL